MPTRESTQCKSLKNLEDLGKTLATQDPISSPVIVYLPCQEMRFVDIKLCPMPHFSHTFIARSIHNAKPFQTRNEIFFQEQRLG